MANDDPPLPGFSGTKDSLYGSFRRERAQKLGGFKRESVKIGTGGSGFFSGGVFSSGGMRLQLGVALTLSIAAGSVAGVMLGGKTGVKPGLEAGSRLDAAMLAPSGPSTAEAAAQTDPDAGNGAHAGRGARLARADRTTPPWRRDRAKRRPLAGAGDGARRQPGGAAAGARPNDRRARRQTRRDRFAAGPAGALRRRHDARRLDRQARARRTSPEKPAPERFDKASPGAADTRLSHLLAMC